MTSPFKPYILDNGQPSFKPTQGIPQNNPVAVISIPKAGTYLMGKILSVLGCIDTEIHAGHNWFDSYQGLSVDEKFRGKHTKHYLSSAEICRLVATGQFMVGHFPFLPDMSAELHGFKRILCIRDLRDAIVSHMRFISSSNRGGEAADNWRSMDEGPSKLAAYMEQNGPSFFKMVREVKGWLNDDNIFVVPFERLYGDYGDSDATSLVNDLCAFLEIPMSLSWLDFKGKVFGHATTTFSGSRTVRDKYWDAQTEEVFVSLGGSELNELYGYTP